MSLIKNILDGYAIGVGILRAVFENISDAVFSMNHFETVGH
jgi:hypothetical protein